MNTKLKSYVKKDFCWSRYQLYFVQEIGEKRAAMSKYEFTELKDDGRDHNLEPINLEPEEAQQMIDALWDAGLRPSEGTGSAGAMAATQKHLEDMRRLVFKDSK